MATERGTTRGLLRPGEWGQTSRSAPADTGRPGGLPSLTRPGEGGRPTGLDSLAAGWEDLVPAELRDLLQELVGGPGGAAWGQGGGAWSRAGWGSWCRGWGGGGGGALPVAAERLPPRVYRLHFREGGRVASLVVKRLDPFAARRNQLVAECWLPAVGL